MFIHFKKNKIALPIDQFSWHLSKWKFAYFEGLPWYRTDQDKLLSCLKYLKIAGASGDILHGSHQLSAWTLQEHPRRTMLAQCLCAFHSSLFFKNVFSQTFWSWTRPKTSQGRGHPFSTYAKFSGKLALLTPWYAPVRVRIRGDEMLAFQKILRTH